MTSQERLRRLYFHEEMDRPAAIIRWWGFRDDPTFDRLYPLMTAHADGLAVHAGARRCAIRSTLPCLRLLWEAYYEGYDGGQTACTAFDFTGSS